LWWPQGFPQATQPYLDGNDNEIKYNSWYVGKNVFVQNGSMVVRTQPETFTPPGRVPRGYTSGMVYSALQFRYGYIEARIKVPSQQGYLNLFRLHDRQGLWPSFWLQRGSRAGLDYQEIDIFEFFGTTKEFWSSVHDRDFDGTIYDCNPTKAIKTHIPFTHVDASTDFRTYAIEWSPDFIKVYYEGQLKATLDNCQNFKAMPIIISNSAGGPGNSVGTPDSDTPNPADILVDYVRVLQKRGNIAWIDGARTVCQGTNFQLQGPYFPNVTANWTILTTGLQNAGTSSGPSYSTLNLNALQPGIHRVRLQLNFPGGITETSPDYVIEVLPTTLQTPTTMSVSNLYCNQYSITTDDIPGATSYSWTLNNGIVLNTPTNQVELTAPYSGSISVVASNQCGSSDLLQRFIFLEQNCDGNVFQLTRKNNKDSINTMQSVKLKNENTNKITIEGKEDKNITLTNSFEKINTGNSVAVYPNPFSDYVNVQIGSFDDKKEYELEIINILGQSVHKEKVKQAFSKISLNNIAKGAYTLNIKTINSTEQYTFKVTKL
jgi:beta-glucanase (GH16 family)